MILKANCKISTRGNDGELITYNKGESFETSEKEGKQLIVSKVAEYEAASDEKQLNSDEDEVVYLSEADLTKMKKADLVKYAASLGLTLNGADKQLDLVNALLDFIDEKQELSE